MNPAQRADERRRDIAAYIKARPGRPLTLYEVASAFNRNVNAAFTGDIDAVRQWALQEDSLITNCAYDRTLKMPVFYYLPAGQEGELSRAPLHTRSVSVRTQVKKMAQKAEYTVKYGERLHDRAYARLHVQLGELVSGLFDMAEEYAEALQPEQKTKR